MKIKLYPCFEHWKKFDNIWIYSDPHFGDEEAKKFRRNYITDEEQIKRINSKVGKKDILIILGDIGNVNMVAKLKGYKILVKGNHDSGISNYQKKSTMVREFNTFEEADLAERHHEVEWVECDWHKPFVSGWVSNHLFDEVYEGPIFINNKILLSHEPINLPFGINIHGHDHNNSYIDERHLNLCAELIDYTPVSLKTIIDSGILSQAMSIHRIAINNRG